MGNVEACCEDRQATKAREKAETQAKDALTTLYPSDTLLGAYFEGVKPVVDFWTPYEPQVQKLETKIAKWPAIGEINISKWPSEMKVLYEFFRICDRDQDMQLQWDHGEVREFCRRMLRFHELPELRMGEQSWLALYRDYERDARNRLNFKEAARLCRHLYVCLHSLATGFSSKLEVAPGVVIGVVADAPWIGCKPRGDSFKDSCAEDDTRRDSNQALTKEERQQRRMEEGRRRAAEERRRAEERGRRRAAERSRRNGKGGSDAGSANTTPGATPNLPERCPEVEEPPESISAGPWYEVFKPHILEIQGLVAMGDNQRPWQEASQWFKKTTGDNEEMPWGHSEVRTFISAVFTGNGLSPPNLTETQWHDIYRHEDPQQTGQFTYGKAMALARYLHEEAVSSKSEHPHELFGQYWPSRDRVNELLGSEWDLTGLQAMFNRYDDNRDGALTWYESKVITFVQNVFAAHGLPKLRLQEAAWYQLYREIDGAAKYKVNEAEALRFVRHIYNRILHFFIKSPAGPPAQSQQGRRPSGQG